ncbi:isochorismatase family cysteine hydrolase [Virgibacillus byunsanensis]|uniref:Isochorismatase family cysteine hydrolase n=1 Tax=Virgibacillus byunsanensis TaxID=570945 RepID=A0ABW3LP53_9BACI
MNIQESALVLIDLQKESNFGLLQMDEVIKNSKKVIDACRSKNIPIIYTRQINRTDGVALSKGELLQENGQPFYYNSDSENIEILDEIKPNKEDVVIDKYRWSAFFETELNLVLKSMGVKHLIIGGVVTDGCLMTSVFDAYFRDYDIHLIKDISSASNEGAHMASLIIMANWVYNISIYDSNNFMKRINGEEFNKWETTEADVLKFTPENMREIYNQLQLRKEDH